MKISDNNYWKQITNDGQITRDEISEFNATNTGLTDEQALRGKQYLEVLLNNAATIDITLVNPDYLDEAVDSEHKENKLSFNKFMMGGGVSKGGIGNNHQAYAEARHDLEKELGLSWHKLSEEQKDKARKLYFNQYRNNYQEPTEQEMMQLRQQSKELKQLYFSCYIDNFVLSKEQFVDALMIMLKFQLKDRYPIEDETLRIGIVQGYKSVFLQDDDGQVLPTHSLSAGLDYAGISPELADLRRRGRVEFVSVRDGEALEGFELLARLEGIIPALESAHAAAYGLRLARTLPPERLMVINLSGRGDKDLFITARALEKEPWIDFLSREAGHVPTA